MDLFVLDWLNLLARWGHLIAGIGWIGTSFYFIALDVSLRKREAMGEGVAGTAWEVHGGGFYHVEKYLVAPKNLPEDLLWYRWEAYLTWVTGMGLLVIQYYVNASIYLIDPAVLPLAPWQAIGLVMAASYLFTQVFSGRGALIHVGALIGSIMAANVFMVIIPNQKKIAQALMRGETPDPALGAAGKQRSVHNTYLTLPVLLMMVSAHYPMVSGHPQAWLLVALVLVIGAAVRHGFVCHEAGQPLARFAWAPGLAGLALAGALVMTAPGGEAAPSVAVADAEALAIVQNHCVACHAAEPSHESFDAAPNGVIIEGTADLRRYAAVIRQQVVSAKTMPLGNETGMTEAERQQLGAWLAAR
jgi:uncharacterized membrane protein